MFRVVSIVIIITTLLFWSVMLWVIPNDYWLTYGLQINKPKADNKIEFAIDLVPQ